MSQCQPHPDPRVPADRSVRQRLRELAARYVLDNRLSGPLSFGELASHAERLLRESALDASLRDYAAVMLHNELARPLVAGVPYDRRLLLLPQCLRSAASCPAEIDELGLHCRRCGRCATGEVVQAAEQLGYIVLVAEGSALVMSLIQAGRVEAIIGVSCMDVLERVFPYMAAAAVPGLALPLLRCGCDQTQTDIDWLYEALLLQAQDKGQRMNLDSLQNEVAAWFEPAALEPILASADGDGHAHRLALDWLALSGKRYRPFLAACIHQALQEDPRAAIPEDFRRVAIAVECFHKASLIHDDIEDHDEFRYGLPALHAQHGVPIALNVGDLLLGIGYRMIATCSAAPAAKAAMLQAASDGHCQLCAGQGAELAWMAQPGPLSVADVIDIFRRKTAPAFDVALNLGATYAGANGQTSRILNRFSQALGIAYQIHDDLEDFTGGDGSDAAAHRPGILLAIAYEQSSGADRELLDALWSRRASLSDHWQALSAVFRANNVEERARRLLEQYQGQAIAALAPLEGPRRESLRAVLGRVVARIFGRDVTTMSCCNDYRRRDDAVGGGGRPTVA